jgi:3-deoxy-D-manno-octulosonate 8-phosphate phosphatase (KDO 8-P phosphatase)
MDITERASKVRLFIMDVDGVLTDSKIVYDNFGDELKNFNALDGFGLLLLKRAGIPVVWFTVRPCRAVSRRAGELFIKRVYNIKKDKTYYFEKVLKKWKISEQEVCYIGDDVDDIGPVRRAGFSVSVKNSAEDLKKISHIVTSANGGEGAIREVCDMVLKAQDRFDQVMWSQIISRRWFGVGT